MSDDSVDQMLILAERLRASNGGVLDDSAIQAVAEATGAPVEYVRLAVKIKTEKEKGSFFATLRSQWQSLDAQTRRFVISGLASALCAFFVCAGMRAHNAGFYFPGEFLQVISIFWLTLGLYNACTCREGKNASVVGALFAAGFVTGFEVFGGILGLRKEDVIGAAFLVPITLAGGISGLALHLLVNKYRGSLGLKDPVAERQDLLRQLQSLQDKLKSGEQMVTFLSVDIVGSTRMKQSADPLAVEYTFNEYHQFVERIARKHLGRVHSTAGDGVTCAFENAQGAFAAARNISTELLELNTFRNKIGVPIVLRQAVHTGTVIAPEMGDIKSVNFAEVIDLTAHLQKIAPEGGVVVSDATSKYIQGGASAIGHERVSISGIDGTVWKARAVVSAPRSALPPPVPDMA